MDELRLFGTPEVDLEDAQVIEDVRAMRVALADVLRVPRRWSGGLRRTTQARAIRGSNTIEGYTVSAEDAVAAVDEEPPLSADERTWAEIIGYRRVLTYILRMAPEPGFGVDSQLLRSLHFMLLEHDLAKDPGRFRTGAVYGQDESTGDVVYVGPDAALVPGLVDTDFFRIRHPGTANPFRRKSIIFIANLPGLNRQIPHTFNGSALIGQRIVRR